MILVHCSPFSVCLPLTNSFVCAACCMAGAWCMWYAQPMCATVRFVRSIHYVSLMYADMRCAMAAREKTAALLLTLLLSSSAGCSNRTQVHNTQQYFIVHIVCKCLHESDQTKMFPQLYRFFGYVDLLFTFVCMLKVCS